MKTTTPISVHSRVLGGLLGVHAGDSLGATNEFASWAALARGPRQTGIVGGGAFNWRAGDATDDTDLTAAVLAAYTAPDGFRLEVAADNMLAWYRRGPRDVGGTTAGGLRAYASTGDPRTSGVPKSPANGSLMRCIPTGLFRRGLDDATTQQRRTESAEISAITHADPIAVGCCVFYNEVVAGLCAGLAPTAAIERARPFAGVYSVAEAVGRGEVLRLDDMVNHGPDGLLGGGRGDARDALSLALAALLDPRPFTDTITDIAMLGGDTDTNAAIAGGLVGVRDGSDGIPAAWVEVLQYRDTFIAAADVAVAAQQ
ncbi:MAG TPA: ADP-ribosylglycohydrolase family protein [Acidimicrobiales bacterium]|nr:ADP-ribosylglycohydrolase family protein [Acidimicrobiales bacterium]